MKSVPVTLGRKGLRRMGMMDNCKGHDSTGFVGGQAVMQRKLAKEGFGLFAGDFPKNSSFCCAEIKTVRFVLPTGYTHEGERMQDVVTWDVIKLASSASQDIEAPTECFNPFMPFGDQQPLPR